MMAVPALKEDPKPKAAIESMKARLLRASPDVPVQLILPARDAALLAYITEEFAKSFDPSSVEGDQLIDSAAAISNILHDVLSARGGI